MVLKWEKFGDGSYRDFLTFQKASVINFNFSLNFSTNVNLICLSKYLIWAITNDYVQIHSQWLQLHSQYNYK